MDQYSGGICSRHGVIRVVLHAVGNEKLLGAEGLGIEEGS